MLKILGSSIRIPRGDSGFFEIRRTRQGEAVPFEPGDRLTLTVRRHAWAEEVLLQKQVSRFPEGNARFELLPDETAALPFGVCRFDVQAQYADGTVDTLIGPADFVVGEEITHDGSL